MDDDSLNEDVMDQNEDANLVQKLDGNEPIKNEKLMAWLKKELEKLSQPFIVLGNVPSSHLCSRYYRSAQDFSWYHQVSSTSDPQVYVGIHRDTLVYAGYTGVQCIRRDMQVYTGVQCIRRYTIQATVQATNISEKITQSITGVDDHISRGKNVIFVLINPYWTDFYLAAVKATSGVRNQRFNCSIPAGMDTQVISANLNCTLILAAYFCLITITYTQAFR